MLQADINAGCPTVVHGERWRHVPAAQSVCLIHHACLFVPTGAHPCPCPWCSDRRRAGAGCRQALRVRPLSSQHLPSCVTLPAGKPLLLTHYLTIPAVSALPDDPDAVSTLPSHPGPGAGMCTPPGQAGKQAADSHDCGAKVEERGQGGLEGSCAGTGARALSRLSKVGRAAHRPPPSRLLPALPALSVPPLDRIGTETLPRSHHVQGGSGAITLSPCPSWSIGAGALPFASRSPCRPTRSSGPPSAAQLPSSPPCPLSTFAPQSCLPACTGGVHIPAPGPGEVGRQFGSCAAGQMTDTAPLWAQCEVAAPHWSAMRLTCCLWRPPPAPSPSRGSRRTRHSWRLP